VLPDRCPESFALVRIGYVQSSLTRFPGGLACLRESLLSSINTVRMQQRLPITVQKVAQLLQHAWRQPDPFLAIDPVVLHQHLSVDPTAFEIEGIGYGSGQLAGNDNGTDHSKSL